jgi:hypothetical protein
VVPLPAVAQKEKNCIAGKGVKRVRWVNKSWQWGALVKYGGELLNVCCGGRGVLDPVDSRGCGLRMRSRLVRNRAILGVIVYCYIDMVQNW